MEYYHHCENSLAQQDSKLIKKDDGEMFCITLIFCQLIAKYLQTVIAGYVSQFFSRN